MMKKTLISLIGLVLASYAIEGCSGTAAPSIESSTTQTVNRDHLKHSTNPTMLVGGWYPVFFNQYDQKQLEPIINQINAGKVATVKITYDQNVMLAKKIKAQIEQKTSLKPELIQVVNQDTKLVQYNHAQVVVTVYLAKYSSVVEESK